MTVFNLLNACTNVHASTKVIITNKYMANLYEGTYSDMMVSDCPYLASHVCNFECRLYSIVVEIERR